MNIEGKHVILFLAIALLMVAVGISVAYNNQLDVSTLGEYGGDGGYVNNVKLEEGSNISITPSGAHNSLVISSSGGGAGITAVGDVSGAVDAFTADSSGGTLWLEGATGDDYEVILTSDDPTGSDFTATLQAATGYVVVDTTACADIEGDALSISTGTLNVDVMELIYSSAFASGDFLMFYETGVGLRRLDYDDLPAGGGAGITAVGDVSGAVDAFTADSAGTQLWFEGTTADDYEVILTSDDPVGADFTATLSDHTGYVVVDVTEVWDLEGTGLSIAAGVLNWAADHNDLGSIQGGQATEYYHMTSAEHTELTQWIDDAILGSSGALTLPSGQSFTVGTIQWNSGDNIDATKVADDDLGELSTATGTWTIDASVILAANLADEDWGEVIISSNAATVDISGAVEESGFTSGDYLLFYDATAGANRKVDYDDLPAGGGGGGITAVGDVSGTVDAFTADSAGNTLWFEGATANDYEVLLTADDPTAQDWTITLPKATGYVIVDATVCSDIEGSGLAIDTGVLELSVLTEDWNQTGAYDIKLANASSELYIMESSGDTYYGILDVTDLTDSNKTYTLPDATGYVVINATVCTDLEGTALSVTTGTLNVDLATTTTVGVAKFDSSGDDFVVTSGDVTLKSTDYVVILTAAGAVTDTVNDPCQTKVSGTNFDYYVCDFDPDVDEIVYWEFQIPGSYTGGNITPTVYWLSAATTGDVEWEMQVLGRADSEAYDAALGAVQSVKTTADGTAGDINTSTFAAFSPDWAAEELVIIKLYRNADDATDDTMTTDARMLNVRISWPSER